MDVDFVHEETDPLASSGMSISSIEDGISGGERRKKKSSLTRLRKLKKAETNGPLGALTPHPPPSSDKSAWNSPRNPNIPNGINHNDEEPEIDPFTGEIKKTRKKKTDPFTSTLNESDERPQNDEDEFEEKVDPFTGEVKRTKKKKDPFIDNDIDKESDIVDESESFTNTPPKKDPFTAMNSLDFGKPDESTKVDPSPLEENRTFMKKDPFTAMNSVDFSSPDETKTESKPDEEIETPQKKDPFTAMNSIDFSSQENSTVTPPIVDETEPVLFRQRDPFVSANSTFVQKEDANEVMNINEPDNETGEQTFEPRATPDGSDGIEDSFTDKEKQRPAVIQLSDDLMKSRDTDTVDDDDEQNIFKPCGRTLSPLHELPSQEQSSPERVIEDQSDVKKEFDISKDKTQDGTTKSVITEIETESDSDDLVVMPSLRPQTPKTVVHNEPIAASTPMKEEPQILAPPIPVPRLNLEEVIRSDEEPEDDDNLPGANDTYNVDTHLRPVNSGDEEDEAFGSGSETGSIGSGTLKANEFMPVQQAQVTETESEIIVKRKERTSITPDERSLSSEPGGIMKKGRLSPITPSKPPPPLVNNFSSRSLRTTYKKDDLSNSMVLSEPIMRSRGELSDTNRSFLSTGALPQITTKQARNRSFLSGGMRNTGSLLGKEELERFFPDRKLSIFIATWNMCELKVLPDNLEDLLLPEFTPYDTVHDMYVIGTQESYADGSEWEISLQETLGPSHVLLHSATHGVLRLLIFIRRDLIWFCSPVEEDLVSTRAFSMIKTKGAVAASFTFFGTSFIFINAHFTSGDENLDDRIQDYDKICKGLQLPKKVELTKKYNTLPTDVTTRFDCVFWCGDFNFRLSESRGKVEHWANQLKEGTRSDYNVLLQLDQLRRTMNKNEIFKGFKEGAIEFIPSYKFDIEDEDDTYDTSDKQRVPSYTDRVLFKSRKKGDISVSHYTSCMGIRASDHKPVCGLYQANIRPGKEDMTLGGGQFSRNVFVEANKRRAARAGMSSTIRTQQGSSVCSVM